MKQLFIVDDHPAIRTGLGYLLKPAGWELVLEAGTVESAKRDYATVPWDLCLLDLNLPDGDGLEVLQHMRRNNVTTPVLVHSMAPDREAGVRVLKAGANGFVHKGSDPAELLRAVGVLEEGQIYVSHELSSAVVGRVVKGGAAAPHDALSKREMEVMYLLGQGMTITAIALKMELNVNTVSTYRARILEKLGLDSTLQLMRYILTNKL